MNFSDQPVSIVAVGSGASGSALTLACRLAEELRESDAAEYSRTEQAVMALYYELRRVQSLLRPWMLGESYELRGQNERLRQACQVFIEARKHSGYGMEDAERAVRAALSPNGRDEPRPLG